MQLNGGVGVCVQRAVYKLNFHPSERDKLIRYTLHPELGISHTQRSAMAPSPTQTTTLPARAAVSLTTNNGPYKELAPIGFEKETELEGKDGHQAAKVRHSSTHWRSSLTGLSTNIISLLGVMKAILLLNPSNTRTTVSMRIPATPSS